MKKILVICIILFTGVISAHPKSLSLVEESLDVTDDELSITNAKDNIVDDNLNILDDHISVIDGEKTVFDKNLNVIEENKTGVGSFEKVVKSTIDNVVQSSVQSVAIDVTEDPFVGHYGKFLKVVTQKNPQAKRKFVQYFSDWQWTDSRKDFFGYAGSRAEEEKRIEYCYNAALKKFGVGTAIVATTWVVAFVVPGGQVFHIAFLIASTSTKMAIEGGALGGLIAAGIELIQGKTGKELIFEIVNGAADGFVIGAISGVVKGAADAYKYLKIKPIERTPGTKVVIDGNVYSERGTRIAVRKTDDFKRITPISEQNFWEKVEKSNKYLEGKPDDLKNMIKKYTGDGYIEMNKKARGLKPFDGPIDVKNHERFNELLIGNKNSAQQYYRYGTDNLCSYHLIDKDGVPMIFKNGKMVELKGERLVEKGFGSFSSNPYFEGFEFFLDQSKSVRYRIVLNSPDGNPGVFVENLTKHSGEWEIIKPRKTVMDVIEVRWNELDKVYDIFANEVL